MRFQKCTLEVPFMALNIIKTQELPGASPPGPPPGLCPGPAQGAYAAPVTPGA